MSRPARTPNANVRTNSKGMEKRCYDSSRRIEKSAQAQQKIIETMVQLLVERQGGDVGMEEIATRSGVSERSIFRFFRDKTALLTATDQYLLSYLKASVEKLKVQNFYSFGRDVFRLFDENESLTLAYIFSNFGREARRIFRRKLNEIMITKILEQTGMTMTPDRRKRLALVVSLVNAKIWFDLRSDFSLSGEEMGETIEWALKTLVESCQTP